MSSSKLKASDRQAIFKKLATALKKKYGGSVPKVRYNVLDTLLFACCLENVTHEQAEAAFERLLESFDDLNVVRVSSVREIEEALGDVDESAWKALRIRECLQYVFEKHYAFDFEPLKRKTMDAAEKELAKIRHLSAFIRLYTLQNALDSHVVPLDDLQTEILIWLGFVEPETTPEKAAEEVKSSLRKNDVALMCHLLRQLGTDRKYKGTFRVTRTLINSGELDPQHAVERLEKHLKSPTSARKKVRKKPATAARKSKPAARTAGGKASKKVSRKKPAAPKATKRPARKK
jgi:endonuclease III